MKLKSVLGLMLMMLATQQAFCWNPLKQGPVLLTTNAVVLIGLIMFIFYIKSSNKDEDNE